MGRKGGKKSPISKNKKETSELVDKLLRISTTLHQTDLTKSIEIQKEISIITDRLINIQTNNNSNNNNNKCRNTASIDKFMNWCTENGAELKGCKISEIKGYDLGLETTVEIPTSSLVISVPRKLMLTIETAKKTPLKNLFETDQMLVNMNNVALAVFLLYEKFKGDDSFWAPYIDILPQSYDTVLYFNVDELLELKGSPTLDTALKQIKSIGRQYAYFYKLFNTSNDPISELMRDKFTYKEYCWAVSTVMTRQNTIPSEDGLNVINALIPLWDICNHTNGQITTDYNPEQKRCECLALKKYNPGEQFFIFYGARTNADLFIHNGFVYDENAHDGYWIKLGISKSDPLREKRTRLLTKLGINPNGNFFIKKDPLPIDGSLLAFIRVFNMNEDQIDHWLESDRSEDVQYLECALDTSLEKKSWIFLQARLKLLLGIYKTTLEDDLDLIKNEELSAKRKLAIRMRMNEKMVLKNCGDYVEQRIKQ